MAGVVAGAGVLSAFLLLESRRSTARAHAKSSAWDENWDMRAPPKPSEGKEAAKPTAIRHLILIRHGQYEEWHSDSDKKVLTELGRKQAMETGLSTLPLPLHPQAMPALVVVEQRRLCL